MDASNSDREELDVEVAPQILATSVVEGGFFSYFFSRLV
jgi:hypothetical protein